MYSNDHCPFCLRSLDEEEGGHYYCGNDCNSCYSIISYSGGDYTVNFYIDDYKFYISNNKTSIIDMNKARPKAIIINEPMIVNYQNKSQVLERIKKLQAFA